MFGSGKKEFSNPTSTAWSTLINLYRRLQITVLKCYDSDLIRLPTDVRLAAPLSSSPGQLVAGDRGSCELVHAHRAVISELNAELYRSILDWRIRMFQIVFCCNFCRYL